MTAPTRWYTRLDPETGETEQVPIGWWAPTSDGGWRDVTPRWLTPVPEEDLDRDAPCPEDTDPAEWFAEFDELGRPNRGTGNKLANFTEDFLLCTKDSVGGRAGTPLRLRPWQRELQRHIYARRAADGKLRHRSALVGMPRKNGKSEGIAAPPVIYNLLFGAQGGEIYSCAADRDQAKIVFRAVKRMVELSHDAAVKSDDPEASDLQGFLTPWSNSVECPATSSFYQPVSRDAYTKEGYNPSFVPFDEVHAQPDRELWDVMDLAMGARPEPMLLGITTAGVKQDRTGEDSLAYSMYLYGKQLAQGEAKDETFFMAWWEPRDGDKADYRSPDVWAEANPGYDDIVAAEDFEAKLGKTPEAEFRTKRLNQWVNTGNSWMTETDYDAAADLDIPAALPPPKGRPAYDLDATEPPWLPPRGTPVVLSFDGSFDGDSTALTVEPVPEDRRTFTAPDGKLRVDKSRGPTTLCLVGLWERPPTAKRWVVDQDEVETVIRAAFEYWDVRVLAYDRRLWVQLFERLAAEGYKVEPMTQGEAMIQAAQRAFEDLKTGRLRHNRDKRLKRHFMNTTGKQTPTGTRVQKETPKSKRHIDAAIAGIQGHAFASRMKRKRAPLVS